MQSSVVLVQYRAIGYGIYGGFFLGQDFPDGHEIPGKSLLWEFYGLRVFLDCSFTANDCSALYCPRNRLLFPRKCIAS